MKLSPTRPIHDWAFTRTDLVVVVVLVVGLAGWLAMNFTGETARITRCAHNLNFLDELMLDFAGDHGDCLPPAGIEQTHLAWDMQIAVYLHRDQVRGGMDPFFQCPSDHLDRTRPRSYAMPAHDMAPANWPPGPGNKTGVGLVWNQDKIKRLLGDQAIKAVATNNLDVLTKVKLSWLSASADTTILTEFISPGNNLKGIPGCTVSSPTEQHSFLQGKMAGFHHGKCNYLMADGHVELLSMLQTGTLDGTGGIWTISKQP